MEFKITKNSRCAVIGYGSWATAIVKILLENEASVGWYIKNPDVLHSIKQRKRNPKYLTQVKFSTTSLRLCDDINQTISDADIVIMAVPSAFLQNTLEPLTVSLCDKFIVSAIKGIIPDSLVTIAEFFNRNYSVPFSQIGIVTGPCHAEEVAIEKLSYLTMVCKEIANAKALGEKFKSRYIKVSYSTDIYGAEYASVLKNIYALAVGIATGLGYGDNFKAVLTCNGAMEMERFMSATYPVERNMNASAYLGDLLVTAYSQFSRNRSFGVMIGKGYSVKATMIELNMIAEGYYATECVAKSKRKLKIDLPIINTVYNILYKDADPATEMKKLTKKMI